MSSRDADGSIHTVVDDAVVSGVNNVAAVSFTPARGSELAVASAAGTRFVDLATGRTLRAFAGGAPSALSLSGDGRRLAIESGAAPFTVMTVDSETGAPVGPTIAFTSGAPAAITLNRAGDRLAIVAPGGNARLFDVTTGQTIGAPFEGQALAIAFTSDGGLTAAGAQSGHIGVFDAKTGETVLTQQVPFSPVGLVFSPDGRRLRAISRGGEITVLDLAGGSTLSRPVDWFGYVGVFSADGHLVAASATLENTVGLIDVATADVIRVLRPACQYSVLSDVALGYLARLPQFSPDGSEVAVGCAATDGQPAEIEVFSVSDGRSLRRLPVTGVPNVAFLLTWSPDGRVIAGSYREQVFRVDAMTGERLEDLALPGMTTVYTVAYSADGRILVAGDPGTAFLFDAAGRLIKTYGPPGHSYLAAGWVPDGRVWLHDVRTGEIRVLEPTTDEQSPEYTGFAGYTEVAIGPDGLRGWRGVASSTANGISLWDVATGQPIGESIVGSTNTAFSSVTSFNAVLMGDAEHRRMMLWDLDPAVWRVRACEAAGRNLTQEEWTKFLPEGEPYHADLSAVPGRAVSAISVVRPRPSADCNADFVGSGCR